MPARDDSVSRALEGISQERHVGELSDEVEVIVVSRLTLEQAIGLRLVARRALTPRS